jgi:hypothetical protein
MARVVNLQGEDEAESDAVEVAVYRTSSGLTVAINIQGVCAARLCLPHPRRDEKGALRTELIELKPDSGEGL